MSQDKPLHWLHCCRDCWALGSEVLVVEPHVFNSWWHCIAGWLDWGELKLFFTSSVFVTATLQNHVAVDYDSNIWLSCSVLRNFDRDVGTGQEEHSTKVHDLETPSEDIRFDRFDGKSVAVLFQWEHSILMLTNAHTIAFLFVILIKEYSLKTLEWFRTKNQEYLGVPFVVVNSESRLH